MDGGSLLDYLVFDLDDRYEVVDARYKSGDRAGEPCTDWTATEAKLARKEITALGKLAVLDCEIAEMMPQVERVKLRLASLIGSGTCFYQPRIQWRSELGTDCEGTPDVVVLRLVNRLWTASTIDLKRTVAISPDKMSKQVYAMGWDIQAAAYREAALSFARSDSLSSSTVIEYTGHTILAVQDGGQGFVRAYPLDAVYMEVGKRRWERGQGIWKQCLDSGVWPEYSEDPIGPPHFVTRTELESYASAFTEEP
jgi:hypothetical protein